MLGVRAGGSRSPLGLQEQVLQADRKMSLERRELETALVLLS